MARIFEDKLESGYEESWSQGESVGAGCTLDENASPADVGSPAGWGAGCLKAVNAAGFRARLEHRPAGGITGTLFFHLETVVTAEGLADSNNSTILDVEGGGTTVFLAQLRQTNGSKWWQYQIKKNGTTNTYVVGPSVSLNTLYVHDIKYDTVGQSYEIRCNGATVASGDLTTGFKSTIERFAIGASIDEDTASTTFYHDNFAVDDADWISYGGVLDATVIDGIKTSDDQDSSSSDEAIYYATGLPSTPEYKLEADFTFSDTTGKAYLIGRFENERFYGAGWNGQWEIVRRSTADIGANPDATIMKNPDGSDAANPGGEGDSDVVLDSYADTPSGTVSVRFEVYTWGKRLYVNDVLRCSSDDNIQTARGRAGILVAGPDTVKIDNFVATEIAVLTATAEDGFKLTELTRFDSDLIGTVYDGVSLNDVPNFPHVLGSVFEGVKFGELPIYVSDAAGPIDPVDNAHKYVNWYFDVTDSEGGTYKWSTKNQGAYSFKVVEFGGIDLRRNQAEEGIIAPSNLYFTITNKDNAISPSTLEGGKVTLTLVINIEEVIKWTFNIKQALPSYQKLEIECEDFLSAYLDGEWPNTPRVAELFPSDDTDNNGLIVPVTFGSVYIPLHSVLSSGQRYYVLGPTGPDYTIFEVRTPRQFSEHKTVWNSNDFLFPQSTKTAKGESWRVFQAVIADSNADGAADANGLWKDGDSFLPMPTSFKRSDTGGLFNPAYVIKHILLDMGVPEEQIRQDTFDSAASYFDDIGLEFHIGYYHQRPRKEILAELLVGCHSVFRITDKVELHVLSKDSVRTVTSYDILKRRDAGEGTFSIRDIRDYDNDAGYVALPHLADSQDGLYRILVPAKDTWENISEETLALPMLKDSVFAQKTGVIYYQRRLLKDKSITFDAKATLAKVYPDQIISISGDNYGGTYPALVDSIHIDKDLGMRFSCIKFRQALDDWADLAFDAVTVNADSSTSIWQTVTVGPDTTPSSGSPPNALRGRLFVGSTVLIDPTGGGKIHIGEDLGAITHDVSFNIADKLYFNQTTGVLNLGGWEIGPTTISATGLEIDSTTPHIKAFSGDNWIELTPDGLEGFDSVLGQTFLLPTDGSPPIFSSGVIKEVEFQLYTAGVIKTSDDPTADGGFLVNNTHLACYDDSSTPSKTFEIVYKGTGVGDIIAGAYEDGGHGLFYDHSEGRFNVNGDIVTYAEDGAFSELTAGHLRFVNASGAYSFAYTKRVTLGEGSDGDVITFTPAYEQPPSVIVLPKQVVVTDTGEANDQTLRCFAASITASGFTIVSQLTTDADTVQQAMVPTSLETAGTSEETADGAAVTELAMRITALGWQKINGINYGSYWKILAYRGRYEIKVEWRPDGGAWTTAIESAYIYHQPTSTNHLTGGLNILRFADGLTPGRYGIRVTLLSKTYDTSNVYVFNATSNVSAPTGHGLFNLTAEFDTITRLNHPMDVTYLVLG